MLADATLEINTTRVGESLEIPYENYRSRLAEYLTGIPLEEPERLLRRVMDDKEKYHKELGFPPIELLVENPVEYKKELARIAEEEELKIISVAEVPDSVLELYPVIKHMKEQPSVSSGCYCEEIDSMIFGDPESVDPKVLSIHAHELVHAIDFKNMKLNGVRMTIEQLEYRAYLLSGFSKEKMSGVDAFKYIKGLFGDAKIVGSSLGYYLDESMKSGICTDSSDFFRKAAEGKLNIPWYGKRAVGGKETG